jgi:hypothetical protein
MQAGQGLQDVLKMPDRRTRRQLERRVRVGQQADGLPLFVQVHGH